MKIFLRLLIFGILLCFLSFLFKDSLISKDSMVFLNLKTPNSVIKVQLADTDAAREQGLSGVTFLSEDSGMLFVFPDSSLYGFWMKDMNFALDIIWVDEFKQIVGIEENVSTSTYPNVFYPPVVVKYVLEVNSGKAKDLGLKKGIKIDF